MTGLGQLFSLLGSRGVTRLAQAATFVLLARALSPEGFGAYATVTAAILVAGQVGNLGLRQSSALQIATGRATPPDMAWTLLLCWFPLAALCAGGVFLLQRHALEGLTPLARWVVGLSIPASLLIILLQGVLLGLGRFRSFGLAETAPRFIGAAAVVILVVMDAVSVETALLAFAVGFVAVAPVVAFLASPRPTPLRVVAGRLGPLFAQGAAFAVSMALMNINGRLGLFLMQAQVGAAEAGRLFAGQRLVELLLELATAASLVLFARTALAGGADRRSEAAARLPMAALTFLIFAPIAIALAVAAPWLVALLLGEAYAGSVETVRILAVSLAPAAAVKILTGIAGGAGRPWLAALIAALGLGVNAAIVLVDPRSAAWGLVASQTIMFAAYIAASRWIFGVPAASFILIPFRLVKGLRKGLRTPG